MPRLNLLVLTEDAERFRGALVLALAHVARGGEAALFLQLDAVRLLAPGCAAPRDAEQRAAGLPDLASLLTETLDAGVALIACQSGLAVAGLDANALDARIVSGGPLGFLADCSDADRLLVV